MLLVLCICISYFLFTLFPISRSDSFFGQTAQKKSESMLPSACDAACVSFSLNVSEDAISYNSITANFRNLPRFLLFFLKLMPLLLYAVYYAKRHDRIFNFSIFLCFISKYIYNKSRRACTA